MSQIQAKFRFNLSRSCLTKSLLIGCTLAILITSSFSEAKTHHSKRQATITTPQTTEIQPSKTNEFTGRENTNWWNLWWQQYINEAVQPTVRPIVSVSFNGRTISANDEAASETSNEFGSTYNQFNQNAEADSSKAVLSSSELRGADLARLEKLRLISSSEQPKQQVIQIKSSERQNNWNSVKPTMIKPMSLRDARLNRQASPYSQETEDERQQQIVDNQQRSKQKTDAGIQMRRDMQRPASADSSRLSRAQVSPSTDSNLIFPKDAQRSLDMMVIQQVGDDSRFEQQQNQMIDYSEDNEPELEPQGGGGTTSDQSINPLDGRDSPVDSSSSNMMRPQSMPTKSREEQTSTIAKMTPTQTSQRQQPNDMTPQVSSTPVQSSNTRQTTRRPTSSQTKPVQMETKSSKQPSGISTTQNQRPADYGTSASRAPAQSTKTTQQQSSNSMTPTTSSPTGKTMATPMRTTMQVDVNETPISIEQVSRVPKMMTTPDAGRVELKNGKPATGLGQQPTATTTSARLPTKPSTTNTSQSKSSNSGTQTRTTPISTTTTTTTTTTTAPSISTTTTSAPDSTTTNASSVTQEVTTTSAPTTTTTRISTIQSIQQNESTTQSPMTSSNQVTEAPITNISKGSNGETNEAKGQTTTQTSTASSVTTTTSSPDEETNNDDDDAESDDSKDTNPEAGESEDSESDTESDTDSDSDDSNENDQEQTTTTSPQTTSSSSSTQTTSKTQNTTKAKLQVTPAPSSSSEGTTQSFTTIEIERMPKDMSTTEKGRQQATSAPEIQTSKTTNEPINKMSSIVMNDKDDDDLTRLQPNGMASSIRPQEQSSQTPSGGNLVMMTLEPGRATMDGETAIAMPMDTLMKMVMNQIDQDEKAAKMRVENQEREEQKTTTTTELPIRRPSPIQMLENGTSTTTPIDSSTTTTTSAPDSTTAALITTSQDDMTTTTKKKLQPPPTTQTPSTSMVSSTASTTQAIMTTTQAVDINEPETTEITMSKSSSTTSEPSTIGNADEMNQLEPKLDIVKMDQMPIQRLNPSDQREFLKKQQQESADLMRNQQMVQPDQQTNMVMDVEPGMRLRPLNTIQSMQQPIEMSNSRGMSITPVAGMNQPNTVYMLMMNGPGTEAHSKKPAISPVMMIGTNTNRAPPMRLTSSPPSMSQVISKTSQQSSSMPMTQVSKIQDQQVSSIRPMMTTPARQPSTVKSNQPQGLSSTSRTSTMKSGGQMTTIAPNRNQNQMNDRLMMESEDDFGSRMNQMNGAPKQTSEQSSEATTTRSAISSEQTTTNSPQVVSSTSTTMTTSAVTSTTTERPIQSTSTKEPEKQRAMSNKILDDMNKPNETINTSQRLHQQQAKGKSNNPSIGKTNRISSNSSSSFIPSKLRNDFSQSVQSTVRGSDKASGQLQQQQVPQGEAKTSKPLQADMSAIRQFGGANRMSALANHPVAFGRPAAMTIQSMIDGQRATQSQTIQLINPNLSKLRIDVPTFEYGNSIAVRRPDEPLANGQVPNCTLTGKNFCVLTKDYPMNEVRQAVERSFRSVRIMYEELQTVSDQELHKDDFNATNQAASGKFACQTQVEMMRPGWAKDEITKEWMLVVNTDVFPQRVRTESCAQPNTPCEFIAPFYDSTCQQRYSLHRMIAIDPHDPSRSPQVAVFKFPAGCVCRVHPIRKTTPTSQSSTSPVTPIITTTTATTPRA